MTAQWDCRPRSTIRSISLFWTEKYRRTILPARRFTRMSQTMRTLIFSSGPTSTGKFSGAGDEVHPDVAWAKLKAMVEGARIASRKLWGG